MTLEQRPAHPTASLNDVMHQRARLGILTVLGEATRVDFPYLKSLLQLTDGNLGRHIEVLAGEGLVAVTKGYEGRRPRHLGGDHQARPRRPGRGDGRPQAARPALRATPYGAAEGLTPTGGWAVS
jgi:hypothetical protein